MNMTYVTKAALLLVLSTLTIVTAAQSSAPTDGSPTALPDLGSAAPRAGSSAALAPEDIRPGLRSRLQSRIKPQELKPSTLPELKPEMSPNMQPNSQKPLHLEAPARVNN